MGWCLLGLWAAAFAGAEAKEDDPARALGALAAYAGHCGYPGDEEWLRSRFGHYAGFEKARKETRLSLVGWDVVRLPCGRVRRMVRKLEAEANARAAAKAPTDYEICNYAVTMQEGTASWDTREAWRGHVGEAKRRGLEPEHCAELLKP